MITDGRSTAISQQHKDSELLRTARRFFTGGSPDTGRKVWVTDTFGDVNGVSRTVETVARHARRQGRQLTVLACRSPVEVKGVEAVNLRPLLEMPLPGYPDQLVSLPPVVEVVATLDRLDADEVLISTPGPLGVVVRAAARRLGLRVSGIYHTDFPAYLRHLLGAVLEAPTWRFMRWFYGRMDRIYVRSGEYREQLAANGFDAGRLRTMPRAVDTEKFHPRHCDRAVWARHGGRPDAFRLLYVGRISKEKNLDLLLDAFDRFLATGREAELALVGGGPYAEELRRRAAGRSEIQFTGVLRGEELSAAYAGGDLFCFPSTTDTLGNVVLEAQASGLAAVVTDRGGPKELVRDGVSGLVVDVGKEGAFLDALVRLHDDDDLRRAMGEQGREGATRLSWDGFLADLWRETAGAAGG